MTIHDSLSAGPAVRVGSSAEQVEIETLRMVWSHARLGVLVATAFAVVLALALRDAVAPLALVYGWMAVKLGVGLFRMLQGWHFARQPLRAQRWGDYTLVALMLDGAVWGAAGLYVVSGAPWPLASFFAAVLACIACVATFGLQISARFTAGYVAPILAPTALGLFLREGLYGQLGGVGILSLLGLQLLTAARTEQRTREGIALRLHAQALAAEKAEALKEAMRQSGVRSQFLANISHELRTPLHGILGMASLLRAPANALDVQRRAELIETSGTHLLTLINDLLDLSRLDAGQFLIRREVHDLKPQIEQLTGIYAMRCEEKGLHFILEDGLPPSCWVMVDPARYRQVMHNLLGNAVKFTQHGSVTLSVHWSPETGTLTTAVADTGPGIAPRDLEAIFEAFRQASSTSASKAAEGAGLGLTIARDIARAMGGDVVARSELGTGSVMVFTMHAPRADAPAATPAALASPERPAGLKAQGHVLLAEDNDINALVALNFLEILGVAAERVKDGAEAVQAALQPGRRPALILMDCHMPVMGGHEAASVIREKERSLGLARVPIVALTATASDTEKQDCLVVGMDDFLAKPCTLDDLNRVLNQWTAQTVTPPALAEQH